MNVALGELSAYDLGRMLEAWREELAQRPKAPAGPTLRRTATAFLTWDHSWRDQWSDPRFCAQYAALRAELLEFDHEGVDTSIVRLERLLRARVEAEENEPF